MKRLIALASIITVLSLAAGCTTRAPQGPDPQEMIAKANALDREFLSAFNRGDAAALAGLYWNSPEVVMFPPDMFEARGYPAIKDGFAKMIAGMPGAKLELTESHQMPAGETVIGYGHWRLTMAGHDGSPTVIEGRYTDVKAERDGKWVFLIDHASTPIPSPDAR